MKYRPIMVLGTGSDVGKSIIATGLCRIFHQEGVRVAPFKAQNMALNSFVTPQGGEMGRAQVVQAQAAGVAPHVDMNPILLKPTREVGSQVIVHGRVLGNVPARDYYKMRPRLMRKVMDSFGRLSREYDLVVLEGAGSAAELNLKRHDLVNFRMAKRAGAAVLLVADIDRGGVFAATIGTHYLLTGSERRQLEGFIINKFRGDADLFRSGVEIIEKRTRVPVLGIVPYLTDVAIPQEDSVALQRRKHSRPWTGEERLRVGVVALPHISNYTDFDPLEREDGVSVRYLEPHGPMDGMDLLILPGTKNTIDDLLFLGRTGLFERILRFAEAGGRVIGICGGYQILGRQVRDPHGVEGEPRVGKGLGLIPVVTTMAAEKTTTQVQADGCGIAPGERNIKAYEIHMGTTEVSGAGEPAFTIRERNGRPIELEDGWVSVDRRIWGTYLHGLFENDGLRRSILQEASADNERGWRPGASWAYDRFQEEAFDRLAEVVRRHVDMDRIREIIRP